MKKFARDLVSTLRVIAIHTVYTDILVSGPG